MITNRLHDPDIPALEQYAREHAKETKDGTEIPIFVHLEPSIKFRRSKAMDVEATARLRGGKMPLVFIKGMKPATWELRVETAGEAVKEQHECTSTTPNPQPIPVPAPKPTQTPDAKPVQPKRQFVPPCEPPAPKKGMGCLTMIFLVILFLLVFTGIGTWIAKQGRTPTPRANASAADLQNQINAKKQELAGLNERIAVKTKIRQASKQAAGAEKHGIGNGLDIAIEPCTASGGMIRCKGTVTNTGETDSRFTFIDTMALAGHDHGYASGNAGDWSPIRLCDVGFPQSLLGITLPSGGSAAFTLQFKDSNQGSTSYNIDLIFEWGDRPNPITFADIKDVPVLGPAS